MAADIVPIELRLPSGTLVTLWATPWRENGEEWQAFLGDDDVLFAFSEVADLVAYVRSATRHDLTDHPSWPSVPQLAAADLIPDTGQYYDLVGVPDLVAHKGGTRVRSELAEVLALVRALAEVCDLDQVHAVLDSARGFGLLADGAIGFNGREGKKQWQQVCSVVTDRWDEVVNAIDAVVTTPAVDGSTREAAQAELQDVPSTAPDSGADTADESDTEAGDPVLAFWSQVGIDPIRIVSGQGEHYTLRCYLDDEPVFLGRTGRIDVFSTPAKLVRHLAADSGGHDLAEVSTWPQVVQQAQIGELDIRVDQDNSYALVGLADDLAEGPGAVDPVQLGLAVELLTDAAAWAGSDTVHTALAGSEPLGWLVSFVLQPDPTRMAPSPPFEQEVAAWRWLVAEFEDRLSEH